MLFARSRVSSRRPPHERAPAVLSVAATSVGYAVAKRTFDAVISALVLIVASPLLVTLAVLIRADSPGPVLFRQRRVGRGGREFDFYKFRTMYSDAADRFPGLYSYQHTRESFRTMYLKTPDDPRLTPFGRRLRTTSLDELPNLINVLRGDMSLVGPRPELPQLLRYYRPQELAKFSVRPGVTGLWQVSGRAILRNYQQLEADVEYVSRRSFWFDLSILVRTARVVALRIGAF